MKEKKWSEKEIMFVLKELYGGKCKDYCGECVVCNGYVVVKDILKELKRRDKDK